MVARLQRATVIGLWFVSLLWFAWRAEEGQWLSATLGAVALLNLQPIVLAFEFFVLLPWHNRRVALPRPGAAQLVRAWWRESVTAHDVFAWQQPFRSERHEDWLDAAPARRGIVLVHGFFCNRGVWNRWMPALRAAGVPYVAVTLEPPFGSIDDYAAGIDQAIARVTQATGLAPVVVAHSMGGMATRAWWRAHADTAAARVHHVLTIATPHGGTLMARMARASNAAQMVPGGAWLRELAADDDRARHFTCFFSNCDNIVLPATHGAWAGADNRHVPGEPHVALIHAPAVWHEAMRRVGAQGAAPPVSPA